GGNQMMRDDTRIRGTQEHQRARENTVLVEPDRPVGRHLGKVIEVDHDPAGSAAAASAASVEMRRDQRIVEVRAAEREALAPPDGWRQSLELLETHVDAGLVERPQRSLDALALDQLTQVTELASSCCKQLAVGTARRSEHAALDQLDQGVRATLHAASNGGLGLVERERLAQVGGQSAREP